ncbi:VOC family protein [Luedemannella helvata]|uniref:VOC family protein n=1 Tax=Luedemannella helvata TaxID=349315 RepID=UPI0031D1299E
MGSRWRAVVVDAADPGRLARWWAEVLDYRVIAEENGEVRIGSGPDTWPMLTFCPVADDRAGKNRLHLDLLPADQAAEIERLVDMGARHVDVGQRDASWTVLADPEGNVFCVLRPAG